MTETGPKLRLRVEFDGEHTLGPGKIRLIELVDQHGSISAAAREMHMSYRHAWELLDDVNRCFRGRVLETEAGGRSGGGARVTDFGRDLVARFHAMRAKAAKVLAEDLRAFETDRHPGR